MAKDIKLFYDSDTMQGDIKLGNSDLIREEGLETAVLISLFTDRRASETDILDDPFDKRGWWGDLVPDSGDKIGSKLWQLERITTSAINVIKIKQAIKEALNWMIEDGVAAKIEVDAGKTGTIGNYRLYVIIKIYKSYGDIEIIKFSDLWEAQIDAL